MAVIYLAGGCFWGTQKLIDSIRGVESTDVGYINGDPSVAPDYELVCSGKYRYVEAVKVTYNPKNVSLEMILFAFFRSIEPGREDGQGNDIGVQYRAGIFWEDEYAHNVVEHVCEIERRRCDVFKVVTGPIESFHSAEEYHQKYLEKNPQGYCHVSPSLMRMVSFGFVDPHPYGKIADDLTEEEKAVVNGGTEPPFSHPYDKEFSPGLYVDRVTGEPLFLSKDKFDSGCGWPAFSKPLDPNVVVYLRDLSHGMVREEVRSRAGNTHLGHVFVGEEGVPGGVRFCINGMSMRFIPKDEMEASGYGRFERILD